MVGGSKAQIQAIVKSVEDDAEEMGRIGKRQGTAVSGWVCLDFDDVVVNVFSEEQRDFYSLDKFWHAAESLDLSEVLVPNVAPAGSERGGGGEDVGEWLLGGDDDWELDDEAWQLPELSMPTPSISAPENKAPAAATPQQLMEALAERARAAQLEQRASVAPSFGGGAQQQAAEAEAEAGAYALDADEEDDEDEDEEDEDGDVDWGAEAAAVAAEFAAGDDNEGVDWEAEAAAVAREMEDKGRAEVEAEETEAAEDWALGDDKLRDLIKGLEDNIETEVDDDEDDEFRLVGGF